MMEGEKQEEEKEEEEEETTWAGAEWGGVRGEASGAWLQRRLYYLLRDQVDECESLETCEPRLPLSRWLAREPSYAHAPPGHAALLIVRPVHQSPAANLWNWQGISVKEAKQLCAVSLPKAKNFLVELLPDFEDHKENILSAIKLNLYLHAVLMAKEHGLGPAQMSAWLHIIHTMHEKNIESPFDNTNNTFEYVQEMLLCHSVCCLPFSADIFSPADAALLLAYLVNTYFRHFIMYKFAFCPKIRMDLEFTYQGEEEEESDTVQNTTTFVTAKVARSASQPSTVAT